VRIVGPDYTPTAEDKTGDVKLIVFNKGEIGPDGISKVGHYDVMDNKTGSVVKIISEAGTNDCGYEALAHLSGGKDQAEKLRLEAALLVVKNPVAFEKVAERNEWIGVRYPHERNIHLLRGAGALNKKIPAKVNREGKRQKDGTWIEKVSVKAPSDAEGSRPDTEMRANTADMNTLPGIKEPKKFISGHIWSEKLGGSGRDSVNIVEMTKSLNTFYYANFEKGLQAVRNAFPGENFQFEFNATMESRNNVLHNISINIGLSDGASEAVRETFNQKFAEATQKRGLYVDQPAFQQRDDGSFTTTFYHNPLGEAQFYEDPNSQYKPEIKKIKLPTPNNDEN